MQETPKEIGPDKPDNIDTWSNRIRGEGRSLFTLGMPILLVQLLQIAVVAADTIMAGRYSATDLSGVAIGGSFWVPIFLFLLGLLSSLTPAVAQLHGAQRHKDIPQQVYQAIWLALLLSPMVIILIQFIEPLLVSVKTEASIRPITVGYLQAIITGLPALLLYNVLRFYSDGVSLTKPAVTASLIGLVVNIPLNYIFIYGKLGLPALGGVGCGWASAISFYVMFLYMAWVVRRKKAYRAFDIYRRIYPVHWPSLKSLLGIGFPIGFAHFVESSMFSVIALFLASLGPIVVAAHQIALNVAAIVFMIPLSLSIALTIRIGFHVGAQQLHSARFTAFYGIALAFFYALFSATVLYVLRHQITALYNNDPKVIALTASLLVYAAMFQLGDALQVSAAGALRGYKDTRAAMYIMIITFWCFGLPLGYALGLSDWLTPAMHAEGFWIGLVVGLFMAAGLLIVRLQRLTLRYAQQTNN